uniref:DUF4116 domain-containing protein n=1 Tax=Clostridioides difficile TaxID=1496 RepID=UPI0031B5FCDE
MNQYKGDRGMFKKNLKNIKKKLSCLMNTKRLNYEACVEIVKKNGLMVQFFKWDKLNLTQEQIEEICLVAVKEDGRALEYINNPTKDMCIEAIKKNALSLEYVDNQ